MTDSLALPIPTSNQPDSPRFNVTDSVADWSSDDDKPIGDFVCFSDDDEPLFFADIPLQAVTVEPAPVEPPPAAWLPTCKKCGPKLKDKILLVGYVHGIKFVQDVARFPTVDGCLDRGTVTLRTNKWCKCPKASKDFDFSKC